MFDQFAPRCRFAIFVSSVLWLFPPNVKDLVWSDEQGVFTYPEFYRTMVLAHEQVPLWSGLRSRPNFWYRKVPIYITKFGLDQIGFLNGANCILKFSCTFRIAIYLHNCQKVNIFVKQITVKIVLKNETKCENLSSSNDILWAKHEI